MVYERASVLVLQKWIRDHMRDEYKSVTNRDKISINSLAVTLYYLPTPDKEEAIFLNNSARFRAIVGENILHF